MRRQRLWVVSELYYPEETSTGYFVTRIAEGLSAQFEVHAVCSKPTYSERHLQVPARERHGGVEIHRVPSTRFDKDKVAGRIGNLLSFTLSAALFCLVRVKRGDRLLVLTNPPTLPPLIGTIARLKGARPSLLVHDVYPEVLVATGLLSAEELPNRVLGRLVSATYGLYEKVIVLGRDMAEVARRRLPGREDRVSIIPNWGDVDEVRPLDRAENAFAQAHNPPGTTVIQFSGNLGRTHDVETVLEAADALAERDDILFQFVGGGGKAALIGEAARPGRVEHLPRQPREEMRPDRAEIPDARREARRMQRQPQHVHRARQQCRVRPRHQRRDRGIGQDEVPVPVHRQRWIRRVGREHRLHRRPRRPHGGVLQRPLGIGGREARGRQPQVPLPQRHIQPLRQAQHHRPARHGAARLQAAQVPGGDLRLQRQVHLAHAPAPPPAAEVVADRGHARAHAASLSPRRAASP